MGGGVERGVVANEEEHVTELEAEIGNGSEDEVAPADGDVVKVLKAEFTHGFAEHGLVGEDDAAVGDVTRSLQEIFPTDAADDEAKLVEM
ncbi:MAG TPA: hypothetical protein VD994_20920 [Prosthecobacter sp.]|nr:hypothetical protein [Prosthecobacter sp.]